jgi:hypothetical protein
MPGLSRGRAFFSIPRTSALQNEGVRPQHRAALTLRPAPSGAQPNPLSASPTDDSRPTSISGKKKRPSSRQAPSP